MRTLLVLLLWLALPLYVQADSKPLEGTISNRKGGIGVRVDDWGKHKNIERVYLDSPAEKAGLLVDDEIMEVDGKPYTDKRNLRGTPGTKVKVTIKRGQGLMEFEITRVPACEISRKWKRY